MRLLKIIVFVVAGYCLILALYYFRGHHERAVARDNAMETARAYQTETARIKAMPHDALVAAIRNSPDLTYRRRLSAELPPGPERAAIERELAIAEEKREMAVNEVAAAMRQQFAAATEQNLLTVMSLDTKCTTEDDWSTTLRIDCALMGRVLAYKLANDGGLYPVAKKLGFKKIVFHNSILNEYWVYE